MKILKAIILPLLNIMFHELSKSKLMKSKITRILDIYISIPVTNHIEKNGVKLTDEKEA
jgi:hypothetical protein